MNYHSYHFIKIYVLLILIVHCFKLFFSPCNLGMLWEVTDGDCDRLTASFISQWIPCEGKESWSTIDKSKWESGNLGSYLFFTLE